MKSVSKLLSAIALGTALAHQPAVAADKMDTILVTEAFHSLLYLPVYVAKHEGHFRNHGLDVPVVRSAGSGPTALASVLAGESQFSVHGPEHVGFAQEKGGKAKAISAVANSAPVWVLARQEVEFSSPADLKGKKVVVGLAPGTSNTLLKRMIADAKLSPQTDVTVTEVQNGSELGPVIAGRADIAVAYQPQVEQGLSQGLKVIYEFPKDYPEYAFSTINTSQQLIDSNPDLVKRFVSAIGDSLKMMHTSPEKAQAVARKEFPSLDAAVVDAAVKRMLANNVYPQGVEITPKAFDNAIAMQKFVGNIKTDMVFADIVEPRFSTMPIDGGVK